MEFYHHCVQSTHPISAFRPNFHLNFNMLYVSVSSNSPTSFSRAIHHIYLICRVKNVMVPYKSTGSIRSEVCEFMLFSHGLLDMTKWFHFYRCEGFYHCKNSSLLLEISIFLACVNHSSGRANVPECNPLPPLCRR